MTCFDLISDVNISEMYMYVFIFASQELTYILVGNTCVTRNVALVSGASVLFKFDMDITSYH